MPEMSVKAFVDVASVLPKEISILVRGDTGIGKSQILRQIAKKWGFTEDQIIDRRLAQMSEGDMIGLPSTDGNVTRFNPPDWYKKACDSPMCLVLDELNRASMEVMQAAFQIVLDRELNGHKLHPESRVVSAVNVGGQFSVNEIDPALLRRFWVADLKLTGNAWTKWAKDSGIVEALVGFIEFDDSWLMAPSGADLSQVQPTPASYERLSDSLKECGFVDKYGDITRFNTVTFKALCSGFIGTDATAKFIDYVKTLNTKVTAEIILNDYDSVQEKVQKKISKERIVALIEDVAVYCRNLDVELGDKQLENIKKFIIDCPVELRVSFTSKLSSYSAEKGEKNSPAMLSRIAKIWSAIQKEVAQSWDIKIDFEEDKPKPTQKKKRGRPAKKK